MKEQYGRLYTHQTSESQEPVLKTSDELMMMMKNVSISNVYSVPRKRGTIFRHTVSTSYSVCTLLLLNLPTPQHHLDSCRYSLRYSLDTLSQYLLLHQNSGYYPICPRIKGSSLILR